jgi:hypothetical protein
MDSEFDPHHSFANFTGDAGNCRRHASVLGPGKTMEAKPRRVADSDAPERGWWGELRHDSELSRWNNRAQSLPFTNDRTNTQRRSLAERAARRRPDPSPLNLVLEPVDGCQRCCSFSFEPPDFVIQPFKADLAVTLLCHLLPFEATDSEL